MFVIVYALTTPFLQAVKQAKAINSKLKACLIVPDLPQYMDADSSLVYRTLKSIDIKKQKTLLKEIDMFTLVSSHMASALNIDKPFIVIEGVIDTKKLPISLNSPMPEHEFVIKKIVYTGGVNTEYGIEGLLKAFSLVKGQDYALIIAGSGNAVQMVKEYAEKDSRIQFLGTLSIEESIKLQGEATLLINPRQPDKDFVKYSFPSKTLEYMMAGKPVLMFKLDGIPNEYDEFLYYFENNNDYEGMAKKIVDICSLPAKQKFERCRKAIEFLRNEKNVLNQTDKILKLLSQI
ncbi:glycosyltransferase [Paenibacillus sp. V4I3]|uniref:glycosyltransferase n=1 Tax=Paenibacillus sp. V4I3 TaxID=3042305 RepID=UPI0027D90DA7|nr:glycosyltransferase [Paenibacillus sp. V4I3]